MLIYYVEKTDYSAIPQNLPIFVIKNVCGYK